MLVLVVYSIFLIGVSYLATQNTSGITLHVASYTFKNLPIYLIILASLLVGLLFSWLVFTLKVISFTLQLREKDGLLKEVKKKNAEIVKQVHQLELENTQLKTKYELDDTDDKSLT